MREILEDFKMFYKSIDAKLIGNDYSSKLNINSSESLCNISGISIVIPLNLRIHLHLLCHTITVVNNDIFWIITWSWILLAITKTSSLLYSTSQTIDNKFNIFLLIFLCLYYNIYIKKSKFSMIISN